MSTQHQPDETLSTESQRRLHALFESWRESRPHWTEECYEAFCAGCMEGYASKAPQIEEAVKKERDRCFDVVFNKIGVFDGYITCPESALDAIRNGEEA